MKISIVMPCFNEISTIETVLKNVSEIELNAEKELIVVDDFSTDGTRELLESLTKTNSAIKAIYHDRNQGKGVALRSGFKVASGDVIIIQDADLEYNPEEYPKLLKPIKDVKADVVYGSRLIVGESHRVLYFWHTHCNVTYDFNTF